MKVDCYLSNSEIPTEFIIIFYRLIRMRPTHEQLTIMLRNNNINVKALAILYIRVFSHHDDVFGWLNSKLTDDDLINADLTISEFAHRLLDEERLNY